MAPFSIPTPSIIPLRLPIFGGPKSIDTKTKIQIFCETYLEHEIFYTIDGTKPQPYAGIVQGNKTIKYTSPFCLPAGKITLKAIAINSVVHTMCSSVVTKSFDVLKVQSEDDEKTITKHSKILKPKKSLVKCDNKHSKEVIIKQEERFPNISDERFECESVQDNESDTNCLEEAFIGSTDFELDSQENDIEEACYYPVNENKLDVNDNHELSETIQCNIENSAFENDSVFEEIEKLILETDKNKNQAKVLTDSGTSIETQFCCLKCDLTLQQCSSCNKMNAVSSKFCIGCGEQLLQICHFCKEWNPMIATFCQFCGKKLGIRMEPYIRLNQLDESVMAKPELKNTSIQVSPARIDKSTQTEKNSRKRSSSCRRMPPMSPGRGYWHQQLDYICNHLKSHAYNNVEFRNQISEPSLCDFKSAIINKEEDNIVVSLAFTPFVPNKNSVPASEDIKSEDKRPQSS